MTGQLEPISACSKSSLLTSPNKQDLVELNLKELQEMVTEINSRPTTDRDGYPNEPNSADLRAIEEEQYDKLLGWLTQFKNGHIDYKTLLKLAPELQEIIMIAVGHTNEDPKTWVPMLLQHRFVSMCGE